MIVAHGMDDLIIVQRCVDPVHETITELDVQALSRATTMLVLATKLWLLMDSVEGGGKPFGPPFWPPHIDIDRSEVGSRQ
jgi:hypothetical protein